MDYYNKFKKLIVLFTIIMIMVGGAGLYVFLYYYNDQDESKMEEVITLEEIPIMETKEEKEKIVKFLVDIKGMVNVPGVYELEEGKRVIDVINLAGGLKEGADTRVNNLSKKIFDEMVIVIYSNEEVNDFTKVIEEEKKDEEGCKDYNDVIENDSCIEKEEIKNEESTEIDRKISINEDDLDLLMTIPNIGESKAKSIIKYREEQGKFETIEDIMNVSGIGDALFEKIKDYITV